ncbi:hypothetical protein [Nitrobacter sp.]|uniref:hypothetical protein n=1 Tax=unclassified Nitrobacter TaxID=2620411 RepID=UPI00321FAEA2
MLVLNDNLFQNDNFVPHDNSLPKARNNNPAGWAIACSVIMLMASLVYVTNGRGPHDMPHEQQAAVHAQLHR